MYLFYVISAENKINGQPEALYFKMYFLSTRKKVLIELKLLAVSKTSHNRDDPFLYISKYIREKNRVVIKSGSKYERI